MFSVVSVFGWWHAIVFRVTAVAASPGVQVAPAAAFEICINVFVFVRLILFWDLDVFVLFIHFYIPGSVSHTLLVRPIRGGAGL